MVFGGFGFDPDRDLTPRTVTLSGRVTLAPGVPVRPGTSLAGIEISAGEARTRTDAAGRFKLTARGRGSTRLETVLPDLSDRSTTGPAIPARPTPTDKCLEVEHNPLEVDFERDPPARTVTSLLTTRPCSRDRPYY